MSLTSPARDLPSRERSRQACEKERGGTQVNSRRHTYKACLCNGVSCLHTTHVCPADRACHAGKPSHNTMIAKIQQHVARHILVIQPRSGAVESSKLLLSSHLCNDIGLRILANISSLSPGQVATGVSAHGTSTIHSLQVPQICHCKCHRVLDSSSLASPPAVYSLIVASHALSA